MELVHFSATCKDARTLVQFTTEGAGTSRVCTVQQAALTTPALCYNADGTPQCFKPTTRGTTDGH